MFKSSQLYGKWVDPLYLVVIVIASVLKQQVVSPCGISVAVHCYSVRIVFTCTECNNSLEISSLSLTFIEQINSFRTDAHERSVEKNTSPDQFSGLHLLCMNTFCFFLANDIFFWATFSNHQTPEAPANLTH